MNTNKYLKDFEKAICKYTGAKYCVLTDSCSNAIFLTLKYMEQIHRTKPKNIQVPKYNYLSVPMAVINSGNNLKLVDNKWEKNYVLFYNDTMIVDSARQFYKGMYEGILDNLYMCCSFHSQKILPIGKGGCILTNNEGSYNYLRRLSWDGRDVYKNLNSKTEMDGIIIGHHTNMSPEMAKQGLKLMKTIKDYDPKNNEGGWDKYYDLSKYDAFKGYM